MMYQQWKWNAIEKWLYSIIYGDLKEATAAIKSADNSTYLYSDNF